MAKPAPFPEILTRIQRAHGTPTYVYFERTLRRQIERLRTALQAAPHRLLYAMKANAHPRILSHFRDHGVGIDAVSPAELLLGLRLGFDVRQILFSANNMTDAEMQFAHAQGVLLNIGELSRLEAYGRAFPGSEVCVRLNPQIGAGHHEHVITAGSRSKFGIPVDQVPALRSILKTHDLRLVGLHQHIGSGIPDIETLWDAVSVILEKAREFAGLRFVNLGGGLGIPYREDQAPLNLEGFSERFGNAIRSFHEETGAEVWLEPGRFYVAEAGVLLASVTTIKDNGDRVFVGIDSGMNHLLRPAMYGSYHEILNLSNPDGAALTCDIVGNICETGDTFARDRSIPQPREGDCLAILDAGAYGYAMSSEYNLRPRPAEVWVPEENPARFQVITDRQTPAALVADLLRRSSV